MPGNEVAPDDQIGFAVVSGEINPVAPRVTDLLKNFPEGALVQRLAVHHDAVHVENDGLKSLYQIGLYDLQPGFAQLEQAPGMRLRQRHDRKSGLADERHFLEDVVRLDRLKTHSSLQRFDWNQINAHPVALLRRWIGVSLLFDAGEADDLFFADAVIEEDQIALLH